MVSEVILCASNEVNNGSVGVRARGWHEGRVAGREGGWKGGWLEGRGGWEGVVDGREGG